MFWQKYAYWQTVYAEKQEGGGHYCVCLNQVPTTTNRDALVHVVLL